MSEFLREGGEGRALQAMLLQHADAEWAQGRNWLERWWLQFAYLMWPDPLPLNSNVFFYFITITPTEHIFQAARLVSTFLDGKDKVDREELPVEFTGEKNEKSFYKPKQKFKRKKKGSLPMDMGQHKLAFTTARIPGPNGDELRALEPGKHLVVICNHRFYEIPAADANGTRLCSQVFERLLRQVWADAHGKTPRVKHSVGLMTSEKRPVWAEWRKRLEPENKVKDEENFLD